MPDQLEKRIPKTTFITGPFQEGLAGDPLFKLECRIPARKADPQNNLHHGPVLGGNPLFGFQLKDTGPFQEGLAGDPLFIPKTTFITGLSGGIGWGSAFRAGLPDSITGRFQEGLADDPLFELDCRIPARNSGSPSLNSCFVKAAAPAAVRHQPARPARTGLRSQPAPVDEGFEDAELQEEDAEEQPLEEDDVIDLGPTQPSQPVNRLCVPLEI